MMILSRKANFLISNSALARPRKGEIKVQQFGVSLIDLTFKNMRIYRSLQYRDLVSCRQLISVVIEKDKTDQLLSFFPADVSKERFPSQEYLFSFAIPHPVPNIAGKLMMKIVRQDLIAVNSSFLHRSINFIRLCRFIYGTFSVTRISLPSCFPPKKTHPTLSKI